MNNVTNLSEHFTLAELTKTNTRIENVPNEAQVKNLKRLCGWLEMLRSESETGTWYLFHESLDFIKRKGAADILSAALRF